MDCLKWTCLRSEENAYLSRVRHVIVVMVNDTSLFLIKLDATFTAQLPQGVTCVTREEY